jgi:predicted DCC family thiol-disulfide oxidoreductase YuxK
VAEHLFYDGECGLCHRWVLFVLAREHGRELFRFAPLQGPTFARLVSEDERRALPDSIVLRTAEGALRVRSGAALDVLERIGGGWALLARVLRLVPQVLSDFAYDRVAAVRKRLFRRPSGVCPLVPPDLARRFDP